MLHFAWASASCDGEQASSTSTSGPWHLQQEMIQIVVKIQDSATCHVWQISTTNVTFDVVFSGKILGSLDLDLVMIQKETGTRLQIRSKFALTRKFASAQATETMVATKNSLFFRVAFVSNLVTVSDFKVRASHETAEGNVVVVLVAVPVAAQTAHFLRVVVGKVHNEAVLFLIAHFQPKICRRKAFLRYRKIKWLWRLTKMDRSKHRPYPLRHEDSVLNKSLSLPWSGHLPTASCCESEAWPVKCSFWSLLCAVSLNLWIWLNKAIYTGQNLNCLTGPWSVFRLRRMGTRDTIFFSRQWHVSLACKYCILYLQRDLEQSLPAWRYSFFCLASVSVTRSLDSSPGIAQGVDTRSPST